MPAIRTFLALLTCASLGLGGELQTLSGTTLNGELVSLSEKEIVFRATTGSVTTAVGDVLDIVLQKDAALPSGLKYADLELLDGTLLHCTKYAIKGKEVEVTLAGSDVKGKVPLAALASLLNAAHDPGVRKDWQDKIVAKRANQDILAIKANETLNLLEGTLGDSGNDKGEISFEYEVGGQTRKRDLDPARAQGFLFLRSLPASAPSPLCKVFDMHQGAYVAAKLDMSADKFTVTTVAGPKFEFPKKAVARLDYSNDKVVFLSDMKPAELVEKSRQGRKETMKLNKNLDNVPLLQLSVEKEGHPQQNEVRNFTRGLAIHAHTEITYNLDGKYQKFDAVLGMDIQVGGDGKPLVTIEADGNKLFSETVTRKDAARKLSFPVKGAKQLRIVVSSTGLFDFGDHVDLANAKLSK